MSGTVAVYAIEEAIAAMAQVRHTCPSTDDMSRNAMERLAQAEGRLRAQLSFALPQTVVVEASTPARAA
jgi:hypothetical protein